MSLLFINNKMAVKFVFPNEMNVENLGAFCILNNLYWEAGGILGKREVD